MATVPRSGSSLLIAAASILNSSTRPMTTRSVVTTINAFPTAVRIRSSRNEITKKREFLSFQSSPSSSSLTCACSFSTESAGEASTPPAPASASVADPPPPLEEKEEDPIKEAANALDIRVGRILKAWRHPEADSLYVEEVDVGEPEPRTICSGLVNYIPLDQLQDTKVVVLANLKPRNMRGIKSNGMLMAASDASHEVVELLTPPEGSAPGERVWFGAEEDKDKQPDAATPNQVQKKKIWEFVQPHLKTTGTCIAVLGAHPMRTSAGVVTSTSLKNGNIS